jgi:hypothetical protein
MTLNERSDMNFPRFDIRRVCSLPRALSLAGMLLVVGSTVPARAGLINEPDPALGAAENAAKVKTGVRYWIELHRAGKTYHVTNQQKFLSGDQIRFHVQATVEGYAYIVLRSGSQGEQAVLFPQETQKDNNKLNRETDYALPAEDFLTFDSHPGIEKVTLLFSKSALNPTKVLASTFKDSNHVVFAAPSHSESGSKDLFPAHTTVTYQSEASLTKNDSQSNLYDSVNGAKPDQGMIDSVIAMSTPDTGFKPVVSATAASTASDEALAKANQDLQHVAASTTGKGGKNKPTVATASPTASSSASSAGSSAKPSSSSSSTAVSSTGSSASTKAGTTSGSATTKQTAVAAMNTPKSSSGAVIVRQDDPDKVLHIDVDLEHSGS